MLFSHRRSSVPPADGIMRHCPRRESWYHRIMDAYRYWRYRRLAPHYRFNEAARAANRTAGKYAAVGVVTGSELQALWRSDRKCRYCRIGLAWREWTVDHAVPLILLSQFYVQPPEVPFQVLSATNDSSLKNRLGLLYSQSAASCCASSSCIQPASIWFASAAAMTCLVTARCAIACSGRSV